MPVELEGGCKVVTLKEGTPRREGDLLIWDHFKGALSLRVLELHGRATLHDDSHDEVLYVLERNEGILIPAGTEHVLQGDFTIVSSKAAASVWVPASAGTPRAEARGHTEPPHEKASVVRL